jgi:hypothetical protein
MQKKVVAAFWAFVWAYSVLKQNVTVLRRTLVTD